MLRITLPLLVGVVLAFHLPSFPFLYPFSAALLLFLVAIFLDGRLAYTKRWVWGFLISVVMLLVGFTAVLVTAEAPAYPQGYTGLFQLQLLDTPEARAKSMRVEAMLIGEVKNDSVYPRNVKLLLYLKQKDSSSLVLMPGDLLLAKLRLQPPPLAMNPGEFDYRQYLANKGIYYCAYPSVSDVAYLGRAKSFSLILLFRQLRAKIIHRLPRLGVEGKDLAVFSALTLGYKGLLDPDTRSDFVAAGAMHVLAVSGLHVGIVYLVVAFMVGLHDKQKRFVKQRALLVIILLWVYAFLTGLPPSVFRATVMFCFVVGAKVFRRQVNIYNSIAASAFVLILIQPKVIYDIGFVLSYFAVISIVYFQPKIYAWFSPKGWLLQKAWALTSVSLAAQIATTPVSVAVFGQFPTYFWLSNIAVILLATVILYLAVPFAIIASLWSTAGWYCGKLLSCFLLAMRWSTDFVEHLPGSLIHGLSLSLWQTVAIMLAIVSLTFYIEMRKKLAWVVALTSIAFAFFQYGWAAIGQKEQAFVAVLNVRSTPAIAMVEGHSACLVCGSTRQERDEMVQQLNGFKHFYGIDTLKLVSLHDSMELKSLQVAHAFLNDSNLLAISFGGKRIIVQLQGRISKNFKNFKQEKLKADLVVVPTVYDALALQKLVSAKAFIVSGYLPRRMQNDSLVNDFWVMPLRGAYYLSING
ncbi:MAG TPA: ComEC/Rec2 family competence protein [Williamwhitmania sp.]|nr:ComEC/Rec2 family competence protein [Williamwhitmania sp.]